MANLTEQSENIAAIERYIGEQVPPKTPAAVAVRDEFLRFMSQMSDYARNFEQAAYDNVRNWKLRYNNANAVTAAEKAAVHEQATRGLSTEQLQGQPDRRLSDGTFEPPPTLGDRLAMPGAVVVGALVAAGVAYLLIARR